MEFHEVSAMADDIRGEIRKAVVGQDDVIELMLTSLLCGGHILLEGVPGTAKTLLAQSFAAGLSLKFGRVQFTPDMMPGDLLGTNLFNFQTGSFALTRGPIFTDILLADEINRTPPKTQAALLQAMNERNVTVDGVTHALGEAFMVVATQNPIEQQGTYPLPEAQLDRFLMQIDVLYPDRDAEKRILIETTGDKEASPKPAMTAEDLISTQRLVRRLPVGESVVEAILDLVRGARPEEGDTEITKHIAWGPGPRAAQALMLATRARALVDGRLSPSRDDVAALAVPVLKHRMALTFAARAEGETLPGLIARLVERLG